jgi:hypothetical protein
MFDRFPRLHFDLAVPDPGHVLAVRGPRDINTLQQGVSLRGGLKALMENIGSVLCRSDYRPPVAFGYPEQMGRQRMT